MNQTNVILMAMVCAGMVAAAPMMVHDVEAFSLVVVCIDGGEAAIISWRGPPMNAASYYVSVADSGGAEVFSDSTSGPSVTTTSVLGMDTYTARVASYGIGGTVIERTSTEFQCRNTPPVVTAGPDQARHVGVDVYLTGKIVDGNFDPTTKSWSCSDNVSLTVENANVPKAQFVYASFRVPSLPNGHQILCTFTGSDGRDARSDDVVITVISSFGPDNGQAQDTGDDTGGDVPDVGGGGQTGGTGGGSGGGFFIPPSFFAPSTSAPSTQSEPEPEPLPTSNGTIPHIRMISIPHMERWNGTTITPFQCNVTEGGSIRLDPIYDGMELIHGTFNVTDSVTGDMWEAPLDTAIPTNATATHNVTVHTTATYNHTQIRPYTVLLDIHAGGLDWSINSETLATFQDIFGTVDVLARYQYGAVAWAAQGGSCWMPDT